MKKAKISIIISAITIIVGSGFYSMNTVSAATIECSGNQKETCATGTTNGESWTKKGDKATVKTELAFQRNI